MSHSFWIIRHTYKHAGIKNKIDNILLFVSLEINFQVAEVDYNF